MEVRVLKMKKKSFLNHFNLCIKSGDNTTKLKHYIFKQYLIFAYISDKFLDKEQNFQDTLCHV